MGTQVAVAPAMARAMRSVVTNGLTMGLSGVSMWGSDIGGFFALSQPQTKPELLIRWLQLGMVGDLVNSSTALEQRRRELQLP